MKSSRLVISVTLFIAGLALSCSAQNPPPFDGAKAFALLRKQCDFGPRVPGSAGHQRCRDWLVTALRGYAGQVSTQEFIHTFGNAPQSAKATNIIASGSCSARTGTRGRGRTRTRIPPTAASPSSAPMTAHPAWPYF